MLDPHTYIVLRSSHPVHLRACDELLWPNGWQPCDGSVASIVDVELIECSGSTRLLGSGPGAKSRRNDGISLRQTPTN